MVYVLDDRIPAWDHVSPLSNRKIVKNLWFLKKFGGSPDGIFLKKHPLTRFLQNIAPQNYREVLPLKLLLSGHPGGMRADSQSETVPHRFPQTEPWQWIEANSWSGVCFDTFVMNGPFFFFRIILADVSGRCKKNPQSLWICDNIHEFCIKINFCLIFHNRFRIVIRSEWKT